MKTFTEKFGEHDEYTVDLEIEPGETQGWVSYKKGHDVFSASLACLDGTGVLTHSVNQTDEHAVPQALIDEINEWAEEQGY